MHEMEHGGGSHSMADEERREAVEGEAGNDGEASRPEEDSGTGLPLEEQDSHSEERRSGDGASDAAGSPQPKRSQRAVRFVNNSTFYLGELLPWKGIQFQVIHLEGETVVLQGIDLTAAERKRLAGKKGKPRP